MSPRTQTNTCDTCLRTHTHEYTNTCTHTHTQQYETEGLIRRPLPFYNEAGELISVQDQNIDWGDSVSLGVEVCASLSP